MNGISPWLGAKVTPAYDALPILQSIGNQILSANHKLCFGDNHHLAHQLLEYQPRQTS